MRKALLFDLDDTLVVEEPAAVAAFAATAQRAAAGSELEAGKLAVDARACARDLWYRSPAIDYCLQIGISSWEGLWCRFEGAGVEMTRLREWSPFYRQEAWRLALAEQGVEDAELAAELGRQFGLERRRRHAVFDDALNALEEARQTHSLALLTNGASCLQREKLAASGLGEYFDTILISAELGVAKPDAAVFESALAQLGVEAEEAVMVGDSLKKDVEGAAAAGLAAIWLNRDGAAPGPAQLTVTEISGLDQLGAALVENV